MKRICTFLCPAVASLLIAIRYYETCTFVGITKFYLIRTKKTSKGYLTTEQHEQSQ